MNVRERIDELEHKLQSEDDDIQLDEALLEIVAILRILAQPAIEIDCEGSP